MVLLILVLFISILVNVTSNYAYDNINSILRGRADELLNVLASSAGGYKTPAEFSAVVRGYIEAFPDKNSMEIIAIDRSGQVFVTSTGFEPEPNQVMPDYIEALGRKDGSGYWLGPLDTDERVMAITRVVRDDRGNVLGAVRYLVSVEKMERQLLWVMIVLIGVGLVIMLFIILSGVYFVRSIVTPVRLVTEIAQQIALGDFDVRIEKKKDDEIGRLCDSVNDMAAELGKTEIMKNDFISSVSHELRTPLTSIKGWAETLQYEQDAQTLSKGMQVIGKEAQRLSGIVEELLDFSRLESGRMKVRFEKLDILSELDEAVYMFTDRAKTEEKKLNYEEQLSLPAVYADAGKLRQVFVNILDNAIKYTGPGGAITVSADEDDGFVVIMVSDTGVGIPAEHLDKIKEKFYKANQMVGGSGIGLAVADEIVQIHCGSLHVASEPGEGTNVTVIFPGAAFLDKTPEYPMSAEMRSFLSGNGKVIGDS